MPMVTGAPKPPLRSRSGLSRFWAALPKSRRVAVAVIPAVLLLALLPAGCGHSDSWQYGYNQSGEYGDELLPLGVSKESVCRSVSRDGGSRVNTDEAYKGCLAGMKDRG